METKKRSHEGNSIGAKSVRRKGKNKGKILDRLRKKKSQKRNPLNLPRK